MPVRSFTTTEEICGFLKFIMIEGSFKKIDYIPYEGMSI
jgi:hypothetical protein